MSTRAPQQVVSSGAAELRAGGTSPGQVVVRAPATSANLGPGFDCLGLALDLWNEVRAAPAATLCLTVEGQGEAPDPAENLIVRSARAMFERAGAPMPPLAFACVNRIPFGRGLGSSAAAIVSGVLLASRYLRTPLDEATLLDVAVGLEGHPDNVVPCLLGGVRVSALDAERRVVQVGVPLRAPLVAALFVPDVTLSTERARAALPPSVPFADATFNLGRAALLVAALAAGKTAVLHEATRDRLHQPYRAPLFPAGPALIKAALGAGAAGACVSGAGPSVLALCADEEAAESAAAAMQQQADQEGVPGRRHILAVSQGGAHLA